MAGAATVEKALDVLFHLHGSSTALGLTEIGRALDLPKSSCHRLLGALVERGVVDRESGGRYRPGLALLSLGLGVQAREPVVRAARPLLESLASELGETVFLVERRRDELRVLDKSEGSGFLRAAPEVGDVIPSGSTAAGRLYRLLADASPPSDAEDARVLDRGYATNRDAWIEGLSVLAVPIWQDRLEASPALAGVLALGAASARFEALGEDRIARRLRAGADEIRARLGAAVVPGTDAAGGARRPPVDRGGSSR